MVAPAIRTRLITALQDIKEGAPLVRDWKHFLITSTPEKDMIETVGLVGKDELMEWWRKVNILSPAPKVSYCSVHDTYPGAGEPCWQCVNKAMREADSPSLETVARRVSSRTMGEVEGMVALFVQATGIDVRRCELVVSYRGMEITYSVREKADE